MPHSRFAAALLVLLSAVVRPAPALAHEGMWLPTLLKAVEGDMRTEGLQITAEDIYSVNQGSLKDAVVLFGGGCTAEVVSMQGLILTNHHCGYGFIQQHSSMEHNYLRDGFRAATLADELPSAGLTATFIIRMEDVTGRIVPYIPAEVNGNEARNEVVAALAEPIVKEAIAGTHYQAVVRPFNYGNSYFLIVSETFRDVRLVAAPPAAIGKFGGDTDNWVWPRHTGDFSVFRIYAGPGNVPADPAEGNAPFVPRHSLPIAMDGVQAGDFAMIFGFPGSTQRYLPSFAVDQVVNVIDPLRIGMRTASLNVIDAAMLGSEKAKLQYAGKQSRISNGWKKWKGEVQGLKALDAVGVKEELEREFAKRAAGTEHEGVPGQLAALYAEYLPYAKARELYVEMVYVGPEFLRFADGYRKLALRHGELRQQGRLEAELQRLRTGAQGYFKNYIPQVDRDVFKALLPVYRSHAVAGLSPGELDVIDTRYGGSTDRYAEAVFDRSLFTDSVRLYRALGHFSPKVAKQMAKDPAFQLVGFFTGHFMDHVRPRHAELSDSMETAMRTWTRGLAVLFPEKSWWPDANSTLRLSYGKVEGAEPRDGISYRPFTTLEGIMEKQDPADPDFEVPQKLIDLYRAKDYGRYGADGDMPVCFLSSLHTTGGNSGSPVLNGRGELIGINFDRMWESTMSDILFDPDKCRNISVDVRYVLFVLDKYLGATRLIDEMELVSHAGPVPVIDLPLHR